MSTDNVVRQTADASATYRERAALDVARSDSTAHDGTIASFTRNNTLVVTTTTFYPIYAPAETVYVQQPEEVFQQVFTPR